MLNLGTIVIAKSVIPAVYQFMFWEKGLTYSFGRMYKSFAFLNF